MGPFFTKDFLIYWRDRKEMLVQLITPIVLIIVLGFAIPGWIENSNESLQMTVAVVTEDDETVGLQEFGETLHAQGLPGEATASLMEAAVHLSPATLLWQLLGDEQAGEFIETVELDAQTAVLRLQDEAVEAIITIPEGFTAAALKKMLLDSGEGVAIRLTAEEASFKVGILEDLLNGFMQELNFQMALTHTLGVEGQLVGSLEQKIGGFEKVDGVELVTAFQYFALSFSILFALIVSVTTATKAGTEKREHVFERILLTGSHPLRYLAGKIGSTFCMSLLQFSAIILISHFILNLFPERSVQFWLGMALIIILFSLCVAAIAALLTSLTFRMKNDQAATGISIIIIIFMGTVGGSFVPIYILPDWLKQFGEWTPNGFTLSVLIQWIQYNGNMDLTWSIVQLMATIMVIVGLGTWVFPKRGRI